MCLHLAHKLHAPAHAGVVHQAGQGKAIMRGVAVAAGAPQLDAAACFPDLVLKAVDVHRAADDLRLFALHFQRHGLGVLKIRQENTALGANDTGIALQLLPDGLDRLRLAAAGVGQRKAAVIVGAVLVDVTSLVSTFSGSCPVRMRRKPRL